MVEEQYLTPAQVAQELQVTVVTVRRWIANRELRATKAGLVVAIAASIGALAGAPLAGADPGPPQGGGGCNMLAPAFTPSPAGLDPMMAGSASGNGQAEMIEMLTRFSDDPFCGV